MLILGNKLITNNRKRLWTPLDLPGIGAWYKVKDFSSLTLQGTSISEIRDKSGNIRHFGGVSNRPTYDATGFNGSPCMVFDGTQALQSSVAFDAKISLSVLIQPFLGGQNYRGIYSNGEAGTMILRSANQSSDWGSYDTTNDLSLVASTLTDNMPYILTMDGLSDGTFWANEINSGSYAGSGGQTAHIGGNNTQRFAGQIAEIVASTSAISTIARQKLAGYFAHQYNLTSLLPVDHPYKTSPPRK